MIASGLQKVGTRTGRLVEVVDVFLCLLPSLDGKIPFPVEQNILSNPEVHYLKRHEITSLCKVV